MRHLCLTFFLVRRHDYERRPRANQVESTWTSHLEAAAFQPLETGHQSARPD
jgi:hypothetical protein